MTVNERIGQALNSPVIKFSNTGKRHGGVSFLNVTEPSCDCECVVYLEWTNFREVICTLNEELSHVEVFKAFLDPQVKVPKRHGAFAQTYLDSIFEWLWPPEKY